MDETEIWVGRRWQRWKGNESEEVRERRMLSGRVRGDEEAGG